MLNRYQNMLDRFKEDALNAQAAYDARGEEEYLIAAESYRIAAEALEKAGKREPKIGDKVRVHCIGYEGVIGTVYQIQEDRETYLAPFRVSMPSSTVRPDSDYFSADQLEIVWVDRGEGAARKDIYRLARKLILEEGQYSVTGEMLESYKFYGYTDDDLAEVYRLVHSATITLKD